MHGLHFTREAVNSANPLRAFVDTCGCSLRLGGNGFEQIFRTRGHIEHHRSQSLKDWARILEQHKKTDGI